MLENSTAGLVMLDGAVAVTVTREEHHQAVLADYTPAPGRTRRVAVELMWSVVPTGRHKGQRVIEVRLDGRRVGELTYLMSQRYAPLVTQVNAHHGRAGCEAEVERDARGLQLTLRLPSEAELVATAPADDPPTVVLPAVADSRTAVPAAGSRNTFARHPKAWTTAVAVFVVLLLASILNNNNEPTRPAAADEATTTVEVPTTTPTTTTTPPPPPPTTTTVAQPPPPQPEPTTAQPAPPPAEAPAPQPQCDPNYSGCVPIASDVDCAGGTGNGPAYVDGPIQVVGTDIYGLDRDGNGTACE
jgi:hypothetical protein